MSMYSLILNGKNFGIPINFPSLYDISSNILKELTLTMHYYIKSQVSPDVLQSFINFWVTGEIPKIFDDNFRQYEQLSKEFEYMREIVQTYDFDDNEYDKQIQITEGILKYRINEQQKTATIIDNTTLYGTNNNTEPIDLMIPRSINYEEKEYIINAIGKFSFRDTKIIRNIYFANNSEVSLIEERAFSNSNIESIYLPSNLKFIDQKAFYGCHKLKYVDFPNDSQLHDINENMFEDSSIEQISIIPPSIIEIKEGWCHNTPNLTKICVSINNPRIEYVDRSFLISKTDSENVILIFARRNIETANILSFTTRIAPHAFDQCYNLKSVKFTENSALEIIDQNAFSNSSLETIYIPSHVKYIGKYAFSNCKKLQQVIFTDDSELEVIDSNAFSKSSIEFILIPSHVKVIGSFAFTDSRLRRIEFKPNSELEKICEYAFSFTPLENIEIPANVAHLCHSSFAHCKSLKNVLFAANSRLQTIERDVFHDSSIEGLSIPSSIVNINEQWLCGTNNLKNINIFPNGVQNIVYFNNSFILCKSNLNADVFDVLSFARRDIQNAEIPQFIRIIASYCFYECEKLQNVIFANNSELCQINDYAFAKTSIHRIIIPSHVSIIGISAFDQCEQLREVLFEPNSELQFIHEEAFCESSIVSITIPSSVKNICQNAFASCSQLQEVKFEENAQICHIGDEAFLECNQLQIFAFPKNQNFLSISKRIFFKSDIDSILIPANIVKLNEGWCEGTPKLTRFFIENGNFYNYYDMYILGKSDPSIDHYDVLHFARRDIEEAIIPSFIKIIAPYAFDQCQKLRKVEMMEDSELQIIDKYAFYRCCFDRIYIPPKVTQIREKAFAKCQIPLVIRFSRTHDNILIDECAFDYQNLENMIFP